MAVSLPVFDVSTACAELHGQYMLVLQQMASLPAGGSVSEGGRSISVSATELKNRLDLITQQAAALGCPIGTLSEPFVITSRARP